LYCTASVGFGPDNSGNYIDLHKTTHVKHSSLLIVAADGLYMGRQSVDQIGMKNCRIGFRHIGTKGNNTQANVAFADGHAETITANEFPCSYSKTPSYAGNGGTTTLAQQEALNLGEPTVYADPNLALEIFLANNPGAN